MYHSISDDPEHGVAPYFRTTTTPKRFLEQMRFLKLRGWRGVSLRDSLRMRANEHTDGSAEKPFALTFDDGYRDFLTAAIPALQECGFGASMFLPTAFLSETDMPRQFLGRECLTWRDIRELHSAGIEFGSHTVGHPALIDLTWTQIENELVNSKSEIELHLQDKISAFSYPFAFPQADEKFCLRFRKVLISAGYQTCVTTEIGSSFEGDDPYCLRRLPVNEADDLALLAAKIEGAYDWLAVPQHAYKNLKRAGNVRIGRSRRNGF
jgi:peptidoglycan/xylan/chitin deacetylase (PgdA/CDA1 family)